MKALIVDDELKSRETLLSLVNMYCKEIEDIQEASSVQEALQLIEKKKPDIIFLDIEMPHENGFQLLEQLPNVRAEVIFTTAYDQYAIKAIKYSALDYLLKPVDPDDLVLAISKIKSKVRGGINPASIEALLKNLKPQDKNQKFILQSSQGLEIIDLQSIICCVADGNYTIFNLKGGMKVTSSKTLKEYEDILKEDFFYRLHNSTIVNLKQIKKYIKGEGGQVVMSDDSVYDVSRRKKIEFLEKLNSFY